MVVHIQLRLLDRIHLGSAAAPQQCILQGSLQLLVCLVFLAKAHSQQQEVPHEEQRPVRCTHLRYVVPPILLLCMVFAHRAVQCMNRKDW